tara:strand:- start:41 stop:454 length:414 start_codon:yes stop_codon:yes gene_type:complete
MKIEKAQGIYDLIKMQKLATIASTANGLEISGNNFKITALTGCPDMLLFACEQIAKSESVVGKWLSVNEPMALEPDQNVWAHWDDGEVELAIYNDFSCSFQRKCGTDEGGTGWKGNVGNVTHYQVIEKPTLPNIQEK